MYREAVRDLRDQFAVAVGASSQQRLAQLILQTKEVLRDLETATETWADRNIAALFREAEEEMRGIIRETGKQVRSSSATRAFALVNRQAIEALLLDPTTGFLSLAFAATAQIHDRVKAIQTQAKILRSSQRAFDKVIARVGILEGGTVQQVKQALITDALTSKKSIDVVWRNGVGNPLSGGNLVINVNELPFVKIPDTRARIGYRKLRIDKYMDTLARTKMSQATEMARRVAMLRNSIDVVQFSLNWALDDDACNVYLGKAFALTAAAEKRLGIPSVDRLPSGGPPLHPNCTHGTIPLFPEDMTDEDLALIMDPPPKWSLSRPWAEVQKEYERRGGKKNIDQFNRAFKKFSHNTGGYSRRNKVTGKRAK